jgi:uncharacterized protein (DUF4415 family)
MTGKTKTEFETGRGYAREDWEDVESPEATKKQLVQARPFAEAFPALAESIKRSRGRPPALSPRKQISIRLSPEVIEYFKKDGPGWQSRIDEALRKAAGL